MTMLTTAAIHHVINKTSMFESVWYMYTFLIPENIQHAIVSFINYSKKGQTFNTYITSIL